MTWRRWLCGGGKQRRIGKSARWSYLHLMSTAVDALLRTLTIPEKVEILQILLDALPEDVMWPSWLEATGESELSDPADDMRMREDAPVIEWPEKVAADPEHFLKRLSLHELALLTEALWGEVAEELPTPDWIMEELEERRRRVESGEVKLLDWEDAVRDLRQRCP
jgi:hypothetical protein